MRRSSLLLLLPLLWAGPAMAQPVTDFSAGIPNAQALIEALAAPTARTKSFAGGTSKDLTVQERRVRLNIAFANNSATLSPLADRDLALLAQALRSPALAGKPVKIEGHANRTGGVDHNYRLTQERALAVAGYLARAGVTVGTLQAIGWGFERPIAGLHPVDGRNRRVEIAVGGP